MSHPLACHAPGPSAPGRCERSGRGSSRAGRVGRGSSPCPTVPSPLSIPAGAATIGGVRCLIDHLRHHALFTDGPLHTEVGPTVRLVPRRTTDDVCRKGRPIVGAAVLDVLDPEVRAVGGMTMGADPIALAVAVVANLRGRDINAFSIRKTTKQYGITGRVVGPVDRRDAGGDPRRHDHHRRRRSGRRRGPPRPGCGWCRRSPWSIGPMGGRPTPSKTCPSLRGPGGPQGSGRQAVTSSSSARRSGCGCWRWAAYPCSSSPWTCSRAGGSQMAEELISTPQDTQIYELVT